MDSPKDTPSEKLEVKPEVIDTEKTVGSDGSDSGREPHVHLHAKTFLAVFAVCLIYFAQLVNLVGAGAVS
jgi:hypothetical protein